MMEPSLDPLRCDPRAFLMDIVAFPQSFERPTGSMPISEVVCP
jgi:hypothetical protein